MAFTNDINSITSSGAMNKSPVHAAFSSGSIPLERTRTSGFSLIELIVVMSLVTVMLGFAGPKMKTLLFEDGTKKASRWLMITIPAIKTKAVREQKLMALGVSIDQDKVWVVDSQPPKENNEESLDKEDLETGSPMKQKPFEFPEDVHIMDVEYPDKDRISVGETEIYFYPKGHSDHAIIHVEDNDGKRYSFLIEPFLSRVKRIDDYVRF